MEAAILAALLATPAAAAESTPAPTDSASDSASQTLQEILGEAADPLSEIEARIQAREYRDAAQWLTRRISELEASGHRFDPRLVRPLTLLGDARAGQGDYAAALASYRRAVHLSRVNHGLDAPEQVEIVYREANALKALGQYQEANDREEYAYHVLNRAHEGTDEALLPGIYHLAGWYEKTGNVFDARALYERALEIIEAHDKRETPEAVPALKGLAKSYRMERFPPYYDGLDRSSAEELERPGRRVLEPDSVVDASFREQSLRVNNFPAGEAALQDVIKIRRAQNPADQRKLAEAVLDLADWYTLFEKRNRAEPLYAHAWELLDGIEDVDAVAYFSTPHLLYFPVPDDPSPPPLEKRGERTTGYVEVAVDVTDTGEVRDLDTVGSEPDGLMDFRVRKSLRVARYRPMLVDGVPVSTEEHVFRHEFPYYPEREPERSAPAEAPTTAARGK